ncbi:MAG: class I SAM-dependent methyltransferase [Bacteroidia bacterium]
MDHHNFSYLKKNYATIIPKIFEAAGELYADYWNDLFHFAIFEDESQSFDDAFAQTHHKYLEAANIAGSAHILELACGRGGFTEIMADHTTGKVLGVDLSPAQLRQARKRQRDNLSFKQQDIMRVDELADTFDAVVFLDAACYLPDKALAIKKIKSVMKPGARLLMVDWCKLPGLNFVQEELILHPFMKYWAIPNLETAESYESHFRQAGFNILEITDLNDKTRKNWDFSYENGLKGLKELSIKDLPGMVWSSIKAGPDGIRIMKEQFPAMLYIKAGFDIGFLRYVYFLVENP